MDATILPIARATRALAGAAERLIPADQFERLLVSHRRMVRVDRRADQVRGLRDLDTGEIFLTDERRLVESRR